MDLLRTGARRYPFARAIVALILATIVASSVASAVPTVPTAAARALPSPNVGTGSLIGTGQVNLAEVARHSVVQRASQPLVVPAPIRRPLQHQFPEGKTGEFGREVLAHFSGAKDNPPADGPQAESTPTLAHSFQATYDVEYSIPPDTMGAVSPTQVMSVDNSIIRVQSRSGASLAPAVTVADFWSNFTDPADNPIVVAGIALISDPRVAYDAAAGRWIMLVTGDIQTPNAAILMAVSATSNATGVWYLSRYKEDESGALFMDYPELGLNKNWIVVCGNMFTDPGAGTIGSKCFIFTKANLYNNAAETPRTWPIAGGALNGSWFDIAPAITYDNINQLYMVDVFDNTTGEIDIWKIDGAVGSETVTNVTTKALGVTWSNAPPEPPQKGSTNKLDGGDDRIQKVVYRNGSIWAVHAIGLPAGTATRESVQWMQLSPTGTVQQLARIDDAAGNACATATRCHYLYPSIAVNANNDALIGYTRTSAGEFPSAAYSFRSGSAAPNAMGPSTILKAGEKSYFKDYGSGANRWGDYSNTVVDPTNDLDLWTVQEYSVAGNPCGDSGSSCYGTWWGHLAMTTPPTVPGAPTALSATGSVGQIALAWTAPASDGGSPLTGYKVYRGTTSGGESFLANAATNSYVDTAVTPGTTYYYKVSAVNAVGEGAQSNEASGASTLTGISLSPASLSFPDTDLGSTSASQSVTVTNIGNSNVTIGTVSVDGPNAADFIRTNDTCDGQTVAPSGTCSIDVAFAPNATGGPRAATLTVPSTAPGSPSTVGLTGYAVGPPSVTTNPTALSFGSVFVSSSSTAQTVTVTNSGTGPLAIGSLSIGGVNPGDFVLSSDACSGATLLPLGSCAFGVRFAPTASGARAGLVNIPSNASGSPHSVTLDGTGIVGTPVGTVSPASVAFGGIIVNNNSVTKSVSLKNSGTGLLSVASVAIGGTDAAMFTKLSDSCTGRDLSAGQSCSVALRFRPTSGGDKSGTLSFNTNASGSPHTSALSGSGLVDTAAPETVITTADGAALIAGVSKVSGTVTDDVLGVSKVTVTFTPAVGLGSTVIASLSGCNAGKTACNWSATVPLAMIGPVDVAAWAIDVVGHEEDPPKEITVTVI